MEKQEKQKSMFSDTLMKVTGAVSHLAQDGDAAIVLSSDGTAVSSRIHGTYLHLLNMLIQKMYSDDKFAQLITEAVEAYPLVIKNKGDHEKYHHKQHPARLLYRRNGGRSFSVSAPLHKKRLSHGHRRKNG